MSGEVSIKNKEAGLEYRFMDAGNNVILIISKSDGDSDEDAYTMRVNIDDIPAFVSALEKAGELNRKR